MRGLKKDLTPMQQAFLAALRDPDNKGDLRLCKELAGYSSSTPMSEVLRPIRDQVIELAKDILAFNAPKAAMAIVNAVDDSTAGDTVERTRNAERILDRVGIVKGQEIKVDVAVSRIALIPARRVDENTIEAEV